MNFLSANVEIGVDDSKLPRQLARIKSTVTKSVDKIGSIFKRMSARFKASWDKMVKYAKWGAIAIVGALTLMARAAMRQEDVENRLAITLKATGHAAGFTKKELLENATALQKLTRFGDETIIAMQTMLLTFKNIKGDEFRRATEAALDMATAEAAVSGRTVDLTAASIRLGKALNDPILGITALSRVGVQFTDTQKELIKTLAGTGKMAEAQNVILAELESQFGGMSRDVNTASGALKQMWNALGDVAEKIGDAFLPGIKNMSKAIREWAERNQERIGWWAEKAVMHVAYVKDILWTFVKFIADDWRRGIKTGLDVSIELFKGFGESVYVIIDNVFQRLAATVGTRLKGAITDKLDWQLAYWSKRQEIIHGEGPQEKAKEKREATKYANEIVAGIKAARIAEVISREIEPIGPQLKQIAADTAKAIKGIMSDQQFQVQISGPEQPSTSIFGSQADREQAAKDVIENTKVILARDLQERKAYTGQLMELDVIKQAEEQRRINATIKVIEFRYGEEIRQAEIAAAEIAAAEETARESSIATAEKEVDAVRHMHWMTRLEKIKYLEDYREAYHGIAEEIIEIEEMLQNEITRLTRSRMDQMTLYFTDLRENMQNRGRWLADNFANSMMSIQRSTSDMFYDTITRAKNWKDALENLWDDVGKAFARMISDMLAEYIMFQAITAVGGIFNIGPAATTSSTSTALPGRQTSHFGGLQHGGSVLKTGLAVVHKGETYSGVGGGGPMEININYIGQERHEVSVEQSAGAFNQQVLNITMNAMTHDANYQKSIARAVKG